MAGQFRFKYSENVGNALERFAMIHRDDDRKEFKNQWNAWITNDIYNLLQSEVELQKEAGNKGDIWDNMFKSARYYYRKKAIKEERDEDDEEEESDTDSLPSKKSQHFRFSSEILKNMDEHICEQQNTNKSPSEKYDDYCANNKDAILVEILKIKTKMKKGLLDTADVSLRFKKTYKNRIYVMKVQSIREP